MTDSRGCEHEGTKVETASNRLNGVADPEGATEVRKEAFGLKKTRSTAASADDDEEEEPEEPTAHSEGTIPVLSED